MISVVVPTISSRKQWLERCTAAYFATTEGAFELIVVADKPTCGIAWNVGAAKAKGKYLHFTADDLEPHEGWTEAAIRCVESKAIPSARVLNSDGSLQSCGEWGQELPDGTVTNIARVPFMSGEQWQRIGPSLNIHYYTDNYMSLSAAREGIPTVVCRDYLFTHHFAPEGRYGQDRMEADRAAYARVAG